MAKIQTINLTTNNKINYIIRTIVESDAHDLISFSKMHSFDIRYSIATADEFVTTIDDEKKWISDIYNNENSLILAAELDGQLIGFINLQQKKSTRMRHTGSLGITVHTNYRENGIGTALLKTVIEWGKTSPQIEKILLGVFANNDRAIHLYKKMGFIEEGRS